MGTAQQLIICGVVGGGGATDPEWANVVHLAHFDGSDGSTTFTNSSSQGGGNCTTAGAATIKTAQSKFGGASIGGNSGSGRVESPNSGDYTVNTSGLFTLEFWIYVTSNTDQALVNFGGSSQWGLWYAPTGVVYFYVDSSTRITTAGSTVPLNTWTFVSLSRDATTHYLHVGGTYIGQWVDNRGYMATSLFYLLNDTTSTFAMTGYMDDFRFTNGVARYGNTSNYTPPTDAFPNS